MLTAERGDPFRNAWRKDDSFRRHKDRASFLSSTLPLTSGWRRYEATNTITHRAPTTKVIASPTVRPLLFTEHLWQWLLAPGANPFAHTAQSALRGTRRKSRAPCSCNWNRIVTAGNEAATNIEIIPRQRLLPTARRLALLIVVIYSIPLESGKDNATLSKIVCLNASVLSVVMEHGQCGGSCPR